MDIEEQKRKASEVATQCAPDWATHFFIGISVDARVLDRNRRRFARKTNDEDEDEDERLQGKVNFAIFYVAQAPDEKTSLTIAATPIKRLCRSCTVEKATGELFECAICKQGRCCAKCGHHVGKVLVCNVCTGNGPETTSEIEEEDIEHADDCDPENDECEGECNDDE